MPVACLDMVAAPTLYFPYRINLVANLGREREGRLHERGLLQALRRYGSCEEWNCAWLSTLSLPLVRVQFHNDAAAWQAACDEGAGVASLRMGNVSFGSIARILGVSDVAVLNWVRDEARKLPSHQQGRSGCRHSRRDVAFCKKKTEKLWLWRAMTYCSANIAGFLVA